LSPFRFLQAVKLYSVLRFELMIQRTNKTESLPMNYSTKTLSRKSTRYYRWVVYTLLVSAGLHVLGVITALGVLQPGLDVQLPILDRAHYVSNNVLSWRLGWLVWQCTALTNLAAAIAIVCYFRHAYRQRVAGTRWPYYWSLAALVFTISALIPEQWAEFALVSEFIQTAHLAVTTGDATQYLLQESRWIVMTTTCGACGYTFMQLAWICCATTYHGRPRKIWWFWGLGLLDFVLFTISYLACHWSCQAALQGGAYVGFETVFFFNALAFPLLILWMLMFIAVVGNCHHARGIVGDP
jgi:hypothetical protein